MASAALVAAALVAAAAGADPTSSGAPPTVQPLFVPSARYPCFRQPAILSCPPKKGVAAATGGGSGEVILAFAENRNVSACAPAAAEFVGADGRSSHPEEVGSLHLRRSTDQGASWLPMQSLFVGNIDFYAAVYDATTGTVHLMLAGGGIQHLSSSDLVSGTQ